MRKVMLVKNPDETSNLTAKSLLETVIEHPGAQGITPKQMKIRLKLHQALDQAEEFLLLEEADWQKLKELYEAFPFGTGKKVVASFIVAMSEELETAQTVKVTEKRVRVKPPTNNMEADDLPGLPGSMDAPIN